MKMLKRAVKFPFKVLIGVLAFVLLYLLSMVLFTLIPANGFSKQPKEGIVIFLKTNGVHTDLVLPVHNEVFDWRTQFDTTTFKKEEKPFTYVAVGWGDKGFYLNTPTWAELKFSTAFNAMFALSTTAMHVTYRTDVLLPGEKIKKIIVSKEQYTRLISYIVHSFQSQSDGKLRRIDCIHYSGANDNFYEAIGTYHLFKTCNVWTNNGLKEIGVKTAFWAPLDKCVLYHF